jgi:hypothetical protein
MSPFCESNIHSGDKIGQSHFVEKAGSRPWRAGNEQFVALFSVSVRVSKDIHCMSGLSSQRWPTVVNKESTGTAPAGPRTNTEF